MFPPSAQMLNSINPQNETLTSPNFDSEDQGWELLARDWLSTIPEGQIVAPDEIEGWLRLKQETLPDHIKSLPRPELYQIFTSIQSSIARPGEALNSGSIMDTTQEKDVNQGDYSQARFQRTDQWLPVYTWLESIDSEEVIKSKDILDWLSANPDVKDDLYSRHSRYHLMHYIKKCHVKILKRKERKKGLPITNKTNTEVVSKHEERKLPVPLPCSTMNNIPTDSDLYAAKRSEALRKYEILVDLEKQLSTLFPKPKLLNDK